MNCPKLPLCTRLRIAKAIRDLCEKYMKIRPLKMFSKLFIINFKRLSFRTKIYDINDFFFKRKFFLRNFFFIYHIFWYQSS